MNTQNSHWFFFIFSSRGNVIFLCHSPQLFLSFNFAKNTPPFRLLQLKENTNKTKTNTEGFIRPEQNTVSVVWGGQPSLSSCSPVPPKTSQELTINTSLWTANRNRIHTMHILINSCPFFKLCLYESLFIGHLIVGDLRYVTVLWCSHHEAKHHCTGGGWGGPIAQGFGTNMINCWLPLLNVAEELNQGWFSPLQKVKLEKQVVMMRN